MAAYKALVGCGVTTRRAAGLLDLSRTTIYRKPVALVDSPPARVQPSKLTDKERATIMEVLTSPQFVDLPPLQIYTKLLDQGVYLASVSTFYRILRENALVKERRALAAHPARAIPELVAHAPGEVYSWDITKLPGPIKGKYYDCYLMMDIYSRYVVGAHVHPTESGVLAKEMMLEIFGIHGAPKVVHADRGTSMTSKTVATLLSDLDVTRSHSRPRVSNDNPYSEALFKTMKYGPLFPKRFASLSGARAFISEFVDWYNHDHQHSGIGFHTPAAVHYGHAQEVAAARSRTLAAARLKHRHRFASNNDPKILDLPNQAWINNPEKPRKKEAS